MKFQFRRKLPTGEALIKEAERLGVSEHGTWRGGAGPPVRDEPELQRRVLAARAERFNFIQTVGIIGALVLTLAISLWNGHEQSKRESADLMLKFDEKFESGKGALIISALDEYGNLDKVTTSGTPLDEALDDFFSKYELLDAAYRHNLISKDMAYDAFSYDLEVALRDSKVRRFLSETRRNESDFYDGVFELAEAWKLQFPPIPTPRSAAALKR